MNQSIRNFIEHLQRDLRSIENNISLIEESVAKLQDEIKHQEATLTRSLDTKEKIRIQNQLRKQHNQLEKFKKGIVNKTASKEKKLRKIEELKTKLI